MLTRNVFAVTNLVFDSVQRRPTGALTDCCENLMIVAGIAYTVYTATVCPVSFAHVHLVVRDCRTFPLHVPEFAETASDISVSYIAYIILGYTVYNVY